MSENDIYLSVFTIVFFKKMLYNIATSKKKEHKMMRKIKRLFISFVALLMAGMPSLGCSATPQVEIKTPIASDVTDTVVSEQGTSAEVGLTAGFPLPHDSGLDRENDSFAFYENDLYYLNDQKVNGRDPSVLYVSIEDIPIRTIRISREFRSLDKRRLTSG
jgi:hypothetical protein